jgi:outer membrane immunogenic protein
LNFYIINHNYFIKKENTMKKISLPLIAILAIFLSTSVVKAQFNPYAEGVKLLTVGVGVYSYSIPVFVKLDVPVADNFTVGGGLSYQSYSRGVWGSGFSIIGIQARGNYHFNELFELDNNQWDVYGGASLGYLIWTTPTGYPNTGLGGLAFGIQIGGRYFFRDNIGINLEFGSGTQITGAELGITFLF